MIKRSPFRYFRTSAGQLFLMLAGALFLAFNVAPTEEMILISFKMTPWHGVALVLVSVLMLYAFVYSLDFAGEEQLPGDGRFWRSFFTYSLAGYGIALIVSLYVLWTFGRTEGAPPVTAFTGRASLLKAKRPSRSRQGAPAEACPRGQICAQKPPRKR